jgi:hypothetical protein
MGTYSTVITEGMKRVCSAFTQIVQPLAFKRGTGRKWARQLDGFEETIFISRSGASYGAPHSPSISLQLDLVSVRVSDQEHAGLNHHTIQLIRRPTGYCYHHRFNAETGSTYDRCLEELGLFIIEVGEPWFTEQRNALKGR